MKGAKKIAVSFHAILCGLWTEQRMTAQMIVSYSHSSWATVDVDLEDPTSPLVWRGSGMPLRPKLTAAQVKRVETEVRRLVKLLLARLEKLSQQARVKETKK
jgi:hypothetical protein